MYTVAILSQKGGAGKTTLALHLAVAAGKAGQLAAVIDLDPQASSAGWKDSRPGEAPVVVSVPSTRLPQALQAARDGSAGLVLIDSAPHSGDVALTAAEAAELVLIPCRAGILDLRAIGATARIVKLAGKRAFVVLNAMPPRAPNVLADARAAVAVHGLEVAPVSLQQRAAYAHALTASLIQRDADCGELGVAGARFRAQSVENGGWQVGSGAQAARRPRHCVARLSGRRRGTRWDADQAMREALDN